MRWQKNQAHAIGTYLIDEIKIYIKLKNTTECIDIFIYTTNKPT